MMIAFGSPAQVPEYSRSLGMTLSNELRDHIKAQVSGIRQMMHPYLFYLCLFSV